MAASISGFVARAEHIAQKRSSPISTAHLLLAVVELDPAVATLLAGHGASKAAITTQLAAHYEEPSHAVSLAVERAAKLAAAQPSADGPAPAAMHCVVALLREPRSAAHQLLCLLGAPVPELLRSAAPRHGNMDGAAPTSVAARPRSVRAPSQRSRRSTTRDQVALAVATESKRVRRTQPSSAEPSSSQAGDDGPAVTRADAPESPELAPVNEVNGGVGASAANAPAQRPPATHLDPERFPLLTRIGRDLSALARDGHLDPVIGRDRETEQLLDILCRRRANNPLLVGPPGVGKTAVVEGLAMALADESPTGALADAIVIEISAGTLLSGTGVRGALGERMAELRKEMAEAGRVILFFDEVHALLGQPDSGDSVANELKTALARGELPCIGATTDSEYRRVFERDAALARRFTRVDIEPPDAASALAILRGLGPHYERHHTVAFAPDALEAAVEMADRYLSDGQLPDSAIGIMDQAASRVRRAGHKVVDRTAVAEVVAARTAVPVERLLMQDGDILMAMESHLRDRVVGQDAAVTAIARAVRRSAAGFRGKRPLGTFLFLGSTGVGKTEMAKALGELVFPTCPLVRIDMSELSEAHAVARLLGAPPGYVGHEDGGQLTEPVRKRGFSLVLLDEIEKAHPEVLLSLLPLLDEGHVTDGRGRRVDFHNTIVVMTSNLGASAGALRPARHIGFGGPIDAHEPNTDGQAVLAAARAALPPELWNRIDEPLVFDPLSKASVREIAEQLLAGVVLAMRSEHDIDVEVDASVADALIAAGGFDPALGARPLKRTIARLVEAPLAEALLGRRVGLGQGLRLRGRGAEILVEGVQADAAE